MPRRRSVARGASDRAKRSPRVGGTRPDRVHARRIELRIFRWRCFVGRRERVALLVFLSASARARIVASDGWGFALHGEARRDARAGDVIERFERLAPHLIEAL